jgi:hypothetical protein
MRVIAISILIANLLLVGCHAPKPNLGIFGTSKVPPHGTGTYRTQDEMADDYYTPKPVGDQSSTQSGRDNGRLPATDVSREIFVAREQRNGISVPAAGGPAIRAASRPREIGIDRIRNDGAPSQTDDGFRPIPARITRSGLQRASYSEAVEDSPADSDPTRILTPQNTSRVDSAGFQRSQASTIEQTQIEPRSLRQPRDSSLRPLGAQGMGATEIRIREEAFREPSRPDVGARTAQPQSSGWAQR